MSLKQTAAILLLVFCIVLAVVVGRRLSTEALAVVSGVVCGIAGGIPTALLLLVAVMRRDRRRMEEAERRAQQPTSYPPVVVIQGGQPLRWPELPPFRLPPTPPQRDAIEAPAYRVLGDE
jgi:hypothetical protein